MEIFSPGKRIPRAILHIEDYDLWRFRWPGTREVGAVLSSYPFEFKVRDKFIRSLRILRKEKDILEKEEQFCGISDELYKQIPRRLHWLNLRVSGACCKFFYQASEIGNVLAKQRPPFGIVWSERDGRIIVSLRSGKGFDVSKIAVHFWWWRS